MPTKYDYVNKVEDSIGTGGNGVTTTINKDSGYPIKVDGDYTLSDEEHDQDIIVTSSNGTSVTITLDPNELRNEFQAVVYNANGADIDYQIDSSNFSGSTTLSGETGSSTSTDDTQVLHVTPGEFHVAS